MLDVKIMLVLSSVHMGVLIQKYCRIISFLCSAWLHTTLSQQYNRKEGLAAIWGVYSEFLCCLNMNIGQAGAAAANNSLSRVETSFVKRAHPVRSSGHEGESG